MLSALLFAWQGDAYVNYAEGVYLFSAQLVADGATPYEDFVAAHPPLLYYVGALAVGEPRLLLALAPLATGAFVAVAVRRLTGAQGPAVTTGLVTLVTPWMLHEHATLMPESLGAPLVMGAALLAARERRRSPAVWWPGRRSGSSGRFCSRARCSPAWQPPGCASSPPSWPRSAWGPDSRFLLFGGGLDGRLVGARQEIGWHSFGRRWRAAGPGGVEPGPLVVLAGLALVQRQPH